MSITYSIELVDCFDGHHSSQPVNGGFRYSVKALADKIAEKLDAIPGNHAIVVKHGECFFDRGLHDAHYWAWWYATQAHFSDDIPF